METYIPNRYYKDPILIKTYTIEATEANSFAAEMTKDFAKSLEWVEIGEFFPVVLNNTLHYTFTIKGGNLV